MRAARVLVGVLTALMIGVPSATAGPVVCYDPLPIVDEGLRRYGLVINRACVQNPYDSAIWVDVDFRYESGDVDGGPPWRCDEVHQTPDPHDDVKAYYCYGDHGPSSNFTLYVDACARLDPAKMGSDDEPAQCP